MEHGTEDSLPLYELLDFLRYLPEVGIPLTQEMGLKMSDCQVWRNNEAHFTAMENPIRVRLRGLSAQIRGVQLTNAPAI